MITQKTILSYDTSKNLPNPEKPALSLQVQASEKETLHWSLLCRFQNFFLMPPPLPLLNIKPRVCGETHVGF